MLKTKLQYSKQNSYFIQPYGKKKNPKKPKTLFWEELK